MTHYYTIVYVPDDGHPHCYGRFTSFDVAQKRMAKMDADLDENRDEAGGGAGDVYICRIEKRSDW